MAKKHLINAISENYIVVKCLGQGCYGEVFKCLKRDTKKIVAVKVLKERYVQHEDIRELLMLEKLRCLDPDKSNIVKLHEWFQRKNTTFMVFESLDISLFDYMYKRKWAPLPLNAIRTIVKDVATALNALKGVGLIHTDLKMDNIMLVDHQKHPFRAKLIDFGLTMETSETFPGIRVQPIMNRSPEVILGFPITEAIDIWSLGTVMAELLAGFPLFPGQYDSDVLCYIIDLLGAPPQRILNAGLNTDLYFRRNYKHRVFTHWTLMRPLWPTENRAYQFSSLDSLKTLKVHKENSAEAADINDCVELLKLMLQMDPRKRITPSKILEHPFITRSDLSPSSHSRKIAWAETSGSQADTEAEADDRCASKLPSGVIMVLPAETTMQSVSISSQAVQKMTKSLMAEHDRDFTLEPVSDDSDISTDSSLLAEFNADSVKTSLSLNTFIVSRPSLKTFIVSRPSVNTFVSRPSVNTFIVSRPSVLSSSHVEAPDKASNNRHGLEVNEPKKKKKKGIRKFFSNLRRSLFSCLSVPQDNNYEGSHT